MPSIAGTLFAYKFKFISGEILFVITIYSRVLRPIPAHHWCRDCYHRHHHYPHHHHIQFYRNYRQMLCQSVDSINLKHLKDFSDRMIYDHAESGMPSTRRTRQDTRAQNGSTFTRFYLCDHVMRMDYSLLL